VWQIAYKWAITKYLDAEEIWGYVWQHSMFIAQRESTQTHKYEVLQSNITILITCRAVNSNKNCEQ